jgi:hypothetical protein
LSITWLSVTNRSETLSIWVMYTQIGKSYNHLNEKNTIFGKGRLEFHNSELAADLAEKKDKCHLNFNNQISKVIIVVGKNHKSRI